MFSHACKVDRDTALQMPLLQINGPRCIRYLAFDIDHPVGALAWEDANLPIPNLILTNPKNGHAHLVWELEKPIWLKKRGDVRPGDPHPVRYLRAVQKAMASALRADPAYSGLLVKNPFHRSWAATVGRVAPYTLSELSLHLDFEEKSYKFKADPVLLTGLVQGSRYITLFDIVRKNAYKLIRYHDSEQVFKVVIGDELNRFNLLCDVPLPKSEITDLKNKISRWTWSHLHKSRRYKIDAKPSDSPTELMRKGQAYQAKQRRATSVEKIKAAIRCLSEQGSPINKSSVASFTGLNRKTVRNNWEAASTLNCTFSLRETEGLRPESSVPLRGYAAAPRQVVPVCQGQLPTLLPASEEIYTEIVAASSERVKGVIVALARAIELANFGIMMTGLPEMCKKTVMPRLVEYYKNKVSSDAPRDDTSLSKI